MLLPSLEHPEEHSQPFETRSTALAEVSLFFEALAGLLLATVFYGCWKLESGRRAPAVRRDLHAFWNKWYFDELYQAIFVRPVLFVSRLISQFDKRVIDGADRLPCARRRCDRAASTT